MGNCLKCNKKLRFWEGYSTFKGEFCNDCYNKRNEDKEKQKEERIKNMTDKEKREKEEMKELLWGKKNLSKAEKIRGWALWIVLMIILMACMKILGWF